MRAALESKFTMTKATTTKIQDRTRSKWMAIDIIWSVSDETGNGGSAIRDYATTITIIKTIVVLHPIRLLFLNSTSNFKSCFLLLLLLFSFIVVIFLLFLGHLSFKLLIILFILIMINYIVIVFFFKQT